MQCIGDVYIVCLLCNEDVCFICLPIYVLVRQQGDIWSVKKILILSSFIELSESSNNAA